ncbi:ATP-dependent DNA helicase [Actinomadura sp. K4S16]|uniref:ATP-dependent helicase n=1 Tax=Actinomadura sp. K4S16 TaxID=1316147 RepID=UPI0011EFA900|nr:ATP-dependent DNA helicase [Actinomadura sp. K4S16]
MRYTEAQQTAIATLDDHLLIVACAGSGKTQVLAQRIVEILRRPDVEPKNVVAFTFTNKAAAELKERVTELVTAELGFLSGLADMFIGTMHAYALDVMQQHVPETFKYGVLDDIQNRLLIDRNSSKSGLTKTLAYISSKPPRPLKRYVDSARYMQVLNILREDDVNEELLPEDLRENLLSYRRLLHDKSYFDYTEQLRTIVDLLNENEDDAMAGALVRHVQKDIRYLIVDEYQDTNPIQEKLIRGLTRFGANLCVVGDDDQTIYQWRGSSVSGILTFADRYPGVQTVTLDHNFRSSRGVVSLGRSVAELNVGQRLDKKMVAAGHQDFDRGDLLALAFDDSAAEAHWICDRIEALCGLPFRDTPTAEPRGLSWSDAAVLFRSVSKDAGPLVEELKRRDIPYVIKGLTRLFEAPEVQACVRLFEYVIGKTKGRNSVVVTEKDVFDAWHTAALGLDAADLQKGLDILDRARELDLSRHRKQTFTLQQIYLDFLTAVRAREERVPGDPTRGELAFYNLGKFSKVITAYEQINYRSSFPDLYEGFVSWLTHQAPDYYAESDADVGYATPDAVTIATVHQAKGMQWPAVFVPAMRRNRFPGKRQGGLNAFHVIPSKAVADADRYRGTEADEIRLFYVAVTRAQKYLAVTFSPGDNQLYRQRSDFFNFTTRNQYVLTAEAPLPPRRVVPRARHAIPEVTLTFSELKYLFECPYQFKLRFLYGFDVPIREELGYGKSLHDMMAEIHKRAIDHDIVGDDEIEEIVDRHLHAPFANTELLGQLRRASVNAVRRYLRENRDQMDKTLYSEQPIRVYVAPGVTVDGRIDLIRRLDTDEVSIVDFKSTRRAQTEDITRDQLHVYAAGYQELTGEQADLVEVLNLDDSADSKREVVNSVLIGDIRQRIQGAGDDLRKNRLPRRSSWCVACERCDLVGICRDAP